MKAFPAILFGLVMTAVVALAMLVIGANALFNKNSVPVVNAASSTSASTVNVSTDPQQQQVAQMQQLINQYQAREKQYQTELNQAAQRINDANAQLDQTNQQLQVYQQVIDALQQRGIIRVDQNGQIYLRGRGGDGG